ncbi:MAG: peptidase rane alanine aminopeptidase [Bryobacterales bacterium]|nr:peptidase rane alanine aminopeptidase [Bryobacterales bacterium]
MTHKRIAVLLILAAGLASGQVRTAAELGRQVASAGLDIENCYRVRDIEITHDELRISLTDGYLMFGKPVNGMPLTAVFSGDTDGGDAEILLLPPDRSERKSMAAYVGSPNLNEHFDQAAFLFTDDTAKSLLEQIQASGAKKVPEFGALMDERWSRVVSNLMTGFESRVVLDLLTPGGRGGFMQAMIQGRKHGNFDVLFDHRAYEQIVVGQITTRKEQMWWDTWASFASRSNRGRQPAEAEVKILSYRINAEVDDTLMMRAVSRLKIRTGPDSRNVIALDLSGQMKAMSAKIDGVDVEIYQRESVRAGLVRNTGNELLLILPPKPLEPGTEHEIEVVHEGKVIVEAGHNVYFVSARGTWYPGRGLQFAEFDVTYRYPLGLDLIAAGVVKEDKQDGLVHVTRRVTEGPVRLLGFNLGKYEKREVSRNGITWQISANRELEDALRPRIQDTVMPPPDRSIVRRRPGAAIVDLPQPVVNHVPNPLNHLTRITDLVVEATAFYRSRFGEPPLKRIEVSPVPGRFGQGFAGMIYLPTVNYLDSIPGSGAQTPAALAYFRDLLVAHEVAHQWWGNVVTSGSYHHEWLMEALANYTAILFMESKMGPKAIEMALEAYKRSMLTLGPDGATAESEGAVVQGRRLEGSNNPNASNAVIYGKGTWIMHMLRRRLGDERFVKMLAELRRRYEWKTLDTDSFRLLCAEFLPPGAPDAKLESFFDQWVYGTGVPALKLVSSVKGKPGAYKLTGVITQTEVSEDVSVQIPVEIQAGKNKPIVRLVRTSSEPVEFTVAVPTANTKAVLDPGMAILHK